MKRRKLTLIFNHFEEEHLGKDVFIVPYYLGKQNNCDVTIVYPRSETNTHFPSEIKGVKLIALKFKRNSFNFLFYKEFNFFFYLIKNAKKIDILMRFHYTIETVIMILLYKFINRNGIAYVKADINLNQIKSDGITGKGLKLIIKKWLYDLFPSKIDIISCETLDAFNKITRASSSMYDFGNKLILMPNGFDEDYLNGLGIREKKFEEKENLIITVGRLGSLPKNTEMFIRAIENLKLGNWRICLIGPVEDSLKSTIRDFYNRFPDKKESVLFEGPIYSKKELWEFYNKAKVFVLTSRWESYALVLNEAKRFRNYLISTEVGAFHDLSEGGFYGKSVAQDDAMELSSTLQKIINNEIEINVYEDSDISPLSWSKMVEKIKL